MAQNQIPELNAEDKKLLAALKKWGVSDEEGMDFLKDLKEEVVEEEQPKENDPPVEEENPPLPQEEPQEENPVASSDDNGEEKGDEVPPVQEEEPKEELPPQEEQPQPPVEPKPEDAQPQPQEDNVDYKAKYEELQKAVDGMSARFDSLEEALRSAGIMAQPKQENPVGLTNQEPSAGGNFEESGEDILKALNR